MGLQRLKMKEQLNYRKGSTSRYCSQCNHYVAKFDVLSGMEYDPKRRMPEESEHYESRCRIIGLKVGRGYKVHPKMSCDRFDNSAHLERLGVTVEDGKVVSW